MSDFEPASRLKQSTNSAHHYDAKTLTTAEQHGSKKPTSKKIKSQNHTIEQHRHQPMDSSALNQMVINLFQESQTQEATE